MEYDEIIDQGLLYGFVAYDNPRMAVYRDDINLYELGKGWLTEEKAILVIGETKDSFITKLNHSQHGEWTDKRILYKYIIPHGFHKDRFVRWEETQLILF